VRGERPTSATRFPADVPVIRSNAIFTLDSARARLGLAKGCLPREIRLGRLRVAKRGGKYLILGSWLLEWIEHGELPRHSREGQCSPNGPPDRRSVPGECNRPNT
jgi:hypothetical protein